MYLYVGDYPAFYVYNEKKVEMVRTRFVDEGRQIAKYRSFRPNKK